MNEWMNEVVEENTLYLDNTYLKPLPANVENKVSSK